MRTLLLTILSLPAWATTIPLEIEGSGGRFLARAAGYAAFFTQDGVHLRHGEAKVRLAWNGSHVTPGPLGKLPGVSNYFIGEQKDWRIGVPHYSRLQYRSVHPGIDLQFYGNQNQLEFDWVLQPGASPRTIEMRLDGATQLTVDASGDLVATTPWGQLRHRKPLAWQQKGNQRIPVTARFELRGAASFGFSVDHHDSALPLTIDPVLGFATNLGGNASDRINSVAVTSAGEPIVAGATDSGNMWNVGGTGDPTAGIQKAFFCKLNSTGTSLYFCSYFGYNTEVESVQLDSSGNIYLAGNTSERIVLPNGPTLQSYALAGDGFLAKFNSTGTSALMWTYLGGSGTDAVHAMKLKDGYTYVTGATHSSNFPVTAGAPQSTYNNTLCSCPDAFIAKLNSTWTSLVFSTYAGSERGEEGRAIDVHADNSVVIAGEAGSFSQPPPTTFYTTTLGPRGGLDGMLIVLSAGGTSFLRKIIMGGTGDVERFWGVATDASGNTYACGNSGSANYPAANQWTPFLISGQAVLVKFSSSGVLSLSTPLSSAFGTCYGIARRGSNLFLSGMTSSSTFATPHLSLDPAAVPGNSNVFLAKTNPTLTAAQYGTVIGSTQTGGLVDGRLAVTREGAWIGGSFYKMPGTAGGIHSTPGVLQPNSGGGSYDAYLLRISESADLRASGTGTFQPQGRKVEYTITVNNDGPDVADDVVLSAATPGGFTLLSATINGANCQMILNTVTCKAGELLSGGQAVAVVTFSVGSIVPPGTSVTYTATATSGVYDPNIVNNTAQVKLTVQ
ncbi:MAG: DUF11 domain-containing protein [Bryobacteraceae bacterium]